MTLGQAMDLTRKPRQGSRHEIFLVCGFQPLHLATFLQAHFSVRYSDQAARILSGLYGDLENNMDLAAQSQAEAAVIVVEWSDLDSRLGLRSSGGWTPSLHTNIIANCSDRWSRIATKIEGLSSKMPVVLVMPTLAPSLFGYTAGWQMSAGEADLEQQAATFAATAARFGGVRLLHPARLAQMSPQALRTDPKMELASGFPYTVPHASILAELAIQVLYPPGPMKGLITDLDDTFWTGIVGEIGAANVQWSHAEHAQVHGLYQQQLRNLSEMGVLLAVASKNEAEVVEQALRRTDLYVQGDAFFPVCCSWQRKSDGIAKILNSWNIGPEGVVFIDDSPLELEEVRLAFPAMTCLHFPAKQPSKVVQLLEQLRDLFGKPTLQKEDALRQSSIRLGAKFREQDGPDSNLDFLKGVEGSVIFDWKKDVSNKRLLELVNKTNQFNLNGIRVTEGEWLRLLNHPETFVLSVSYQDKFGPLGVIGVVAGLQKGKTLEVFHWVMSCRAFSRRIEFHTLNQLLEVDGVDQIALQKKVTERNLPLQAFLRIVSDPTVNESSEPVVSKVRFVNRHELPHRVEATRELVSAP